MPISRRVAISTALAAATLPARVRAQTPDVLRLGVLTDLSGPYRDSAGPTTVVCVKQAVEEFTAANPGMKVEVLSADHQQKADVALGIAREWFDRGGVDAVINVNNSAIALGMNRLVQEKDKVHLNSGAVSADLTGIGCCPNMVHWTYDSWEMAHSTGTAIVKTGGDSWFFLLPDYVFGHTLERDTTAAVKKAGGSVVGSVAYPFPTTADFSAYLLQAQASGAKVVGLCNASGDTVNCVKQAHEFGLTDRGTRLAGMILFTTDVHALGLDVAKGLVFTSNFYWDLNDRTRSFLDRVRAKTPDNWPNQQHAGDYAVTLHYLKAAKALGVAATKTSGAKAIATMKAMPTDDDCFGAGRIREDGQHLHPAYLFEVKSPAESRGPWDYFKLLATTPAEEAFRPLAEGGCKFVHS